MRFVTLGGGTGLSTLLQGLKHHLLIEGGREKPAVAHSLAKDEAKLWITELTAVVTVSDDGGSSGRLRRELKVLPPGDIRNCMVALSEDEALLSRLFQYRFSSGRGLRGHSFGNLFLTALTGITGDFQEAVRVTSEVLAIHGRIFPSTMYDLRLEATLENGHVVQGETRISRSRSMIRQIRLVPPSCLPMPETLDAIARADVITLGPGSLYTSVIPNLLVPKVARKIATSRAAKIYICNLMTQPGETTGYSASDHIQAIEKHCGRRIFDYVLLNTAPIAPNLERRYRQQRSEPVEHDTQEIRKLGVQPVIKPLVSKESSKLTAKKLVRHDPNLLAEAVIEIADQHALAKI